MTNNPDVRTGLNNFVTNLLIQLLSVSDHTLPPTIRLLVNPDNSITNIKGNYPSTDITSPTIGR